MILCPAVQYILPERLGVHLLHRIENVKMIGEMLFLESVEDNHLKGQFPLQKREKEEEESAYVFSKQLV